MQYKSLLKRKNDSQEPAKDSYTRITTYIKANERRQCNIETYKCPVCGNTDIHSIGILNGKPYCRRCIFFKGEEVEHKPSYPKKAPIHLSYELSPEQKELSDKLVENYKKGIDSLVFAVCGSGKTDIVFKTIQEALKEVKQVGFAIPRRDVVIELARRLQTAFNSYIVTCVFGGNTSFLVGHIICLTTHQLYRYEAYFDLLIVDEIDAFPYNGNKLLHIFVDRACKGRKILMTATPSKAILKEYSTEEKQTLTLFKRYHGDPIPVPIIKLLRMPLNLFYLVKKTRLFIEQNKPLLIFVPTIYKCEKVYYFLKNLAKTGYFLHSKVENRKEIVDEFRAGKFNYLVTTSVLERGVTLKDLQVIVYDADSKIYSKEALIQISGRVGRVVGYTKGEVIFIAKNINRPIRDAIYEIERANSGL